MYVNELSLVASSCVFDADRLYTGSYVVKTLFYVRSGPGMWEGSYFFVLTVLLASN